MIRSDPAGVSRRFYKSDISQPRAQLLFFSPRANDPRTILEGGVMGPLETAVRSDVEQLGDLVGIEPSLSEMAFSLARRIDAAATGQCDTCGEAVAVEDKLLPQLNRELRQTLAQMLEGRAAEDDDDLGDLASPD